MGSRGWIRHWGVATVVALAGCYSGIESDDDGGPAVSGAPNDGDEGTKPDDPDDDGPAGDDGSEPDGTDDGDAPADDDGQAEDDDGGNDDDDDGAGEDTGDDDEGGDTGQADGQGDDDGGPPSDEVPDNEYCSEVAGWDPQWSQLEAEVLDIVNQKRAAGANCGSEGSFGPAAPLTMNPALRCAARKHSKDMADRGFFDHTNPSGESPWVRFEKAGYSYSTAGENIAAGSATAAGTMNQWMGSDGHCANIMSPDFEEIGVGYYPGGEYGHLWTQGFGAQ